MMAIEIHDLAAHVDEVLQQLREQGVWVDVLDQGEVVARLMPVNRSPAARSDEQILADMDRLAVEIAAHWPEGVSALDTVHDVRREL